MSVKIVADSISSQHHRITTFEVTFPRIILCEILTHRVFSRNTASSRAIPVKKLAQSVRENMYVPNFTKACAGMVSNETVPDLEGPTLLWTQLALRSCEIAEFLAGTHQVHKQHANRVLEPYSNVKMVITATEWSNFFKLRTHKDAQPDFQKLARHMYILMHDSKPVQREEHLPYTEEGDLTQSRIIDSVANCARTSYTLPEKERIQGKDNLELFKTLKAAGHMSPFEHVAFAQQKGFRWSNNFWGWDQYREQIETEETDFTVSDEELNTWRKSLNLSSVTT